MLILRESGYFKFFSILILLVFSSVFVIFSSFNFPLRAQQTDIDKILEEGKKAYMDGDYEKAIQLLNQAIALIKNKSTLIDAHLSLALTYFTVNQMENCTEQIKSILKLNPSFKPDPEFYSPKFVKLFEDVRKANTREVTVTSVPEGANIFIDEENKGYTPFKGMLYTGKHKIKIVKEGFSSVEKEINVERTRENIFEVILTPLTPQEVKIPTEEKPVEKKVEEVKPEEKKVEEMPEVKEKYEKEEKKKSSALIYLIGGAIVAGVVVALLLSKKKEEGKGSIPPRSTPTGARIYLDGADTGKVTNAVLTDVKAGTHTVTLRKDRYREYSTSVNVVKNQTASVNASLDPGAFVENFDDNVADYWVNDGTGRWRAAGGLYRMDGKGLNSYARTYYSIGPYSNFTLELYLNDLGGTGHDRAILIRGTDTSFKNCYSFDIAVPGYYSVWKAVNNVWYSIKAWTSHSAVRGANNWNKLKIVCSGSTMTFYINDINVYSFSDTSYSSGYFGIEVYDYSTADRVLIDNLSVSLSTAGSSTNPENVVPLLVPGNIKSISKIKGETP